MGVHLKLLTCLLLFLLYDNAYSQVDGDLEAYCKAEARKRIEPKEVQKEEQKGGQTGGQVEKQTQKGLTNEEKTKIGNEISDEYFLHFFQKCVADFYGFKDVNNEKWEKNAPTFGDVLQTEHFRNVAKTIELFFMKTADEEKNEKRNWEQINEAMKSIQDENKAEANKDKQVKDKEANMDEKANKEKCRKMLLVIAARQLYVTYELVIAARQLYPTYVKEKGADCNDFHLCKKTVEGKIIIPKCACYPKNEGSARCTSDYDVGLIGPHAGKMVPIYNKHYQTTFGMTPERLFDNNLYAYDLEFAAPEIFMLPSEVKEELDKKNDKIKANKEKQKEGKKVEEVKKSGQMMYFEYLQEIKEKTKTTPRYQTVNIALAYTKVYIFEPIEEDFYEKQFGLCLDRNLYKESVESWLKDLKNIKNQDIVGMDDEKKMEKYEFQISDANDPWSHAKTSRVATAFSRIYASEAYFSNGALRVVVGSKQMENKIITEGLSVVDHWASFIENFGDVLKEHGRSCQNENVDIYTCLLKLSKYLLRTFTSIRAIVTSTIYGSINDGTGKCVFQQEELDAIKRFVGKEDENKPAVVVGIVNSWVTCFKDKGENKIRETYTLKKCFGDEKVEKTKLKDVLSDESKDWASYFLKEILNCEKEELKKASSYYKWQDVLENKGTNVGNIEQPKELTTQKILPPPEVRLDKGSCMSKLKFLVRGINRKMLLYAATDETNIGKKLEKKKDTAKTL